MAEDKITLYETDNEDLKEFIKNTPYKPVVMLGVKNDLQRIKDEFIKLYNPLINYLTYFISEAGYHGWDYQDEKFQNMVNLTKDIQKKFLEIYALTEIGLGNEIEFKQ